MFEILNLIHYLQLRRNAPAVAPVKRKYRRQPPRQAPGARRLDPNAPWLAQIRDAKQ